MNGSNYDPVDPKTAGVAIEGGSAHTVLVLAAALLTGIGGGFGFVRAATLLRKARRVR